MKRLLFTVLSIGIVFTCTQTPQQAGTVDDVGSIAGQLLTKNGKPVDYTVTVALYTIDAATTSAFQAGLPKLRSRSGTPFRTIETATGFYAFDSIPAGDYRIEVSEEGIVVAREDNFTLAPNNPRTDTIHVEEVISLAFTIKEEQPREIIIGESTIENCRITSTDSGYIVKTVKADEFSFKMVIQQQNLAIDTVEVHATISEEGVAAFDVIDGPVDLTVSRTGSERPMHAGMKLIPAGTYIMGPDSTVYNSGDQCITRRTTLTHDFWMDSTEVTQRDYADLMAATYGSSFIPKWDSIGHTSFIPIWDTIGYGAGDNYPAHTLSWVDAVLYCNARTKATGSMDTVYRYESIEPRPDSGNGIVFKGLVIDLSRSGFHLPTEAQWEYACRAGTTTDYYFDSASTDDYAWHKGNSGGTAHPVAQKLPNAFGLYDMCGNVCEWCNDWHWMYDSTSLTDPIGPDSVPGGTRASRGGDWALYCAKSYSRYPVPFESRIPPCGFRACLTVQ
ncbi:MAG: SUMF1/EgtB/PvdO family nonheme iron enzyme [Chitinispirillaceae bacterium]|nr:SUMF1/EgtB/PvdO family nonheme iron enzyme [Chitinispirillaceae bacterium]